MRLVGILSLCAAVIMLAASPVLAQDISPERIKAAERYWQAGNFEKSFISNMEKSLTRMPPEQQRNLRKLIDEVSTDQKLKEMSIQTTAQSFTTEELNALADFYSSPTGQSIMVKMPAYMSGLSRIMQTRVMELMEKYVPSPPRGMGKGKGMGQGMGAKPQKP